MRIPGRVTNLVSIAGLALLFPIEASAAKDLADYPLRIEIVGAAARCVPAPGSYLPCPNGYRGFGPGNVLDGQSVIGFEFEYRCSVGLRPSMVITWPGKWKKPQLRLALLVPRTGEVDKYDECELQTKMRPQPGGWGLSHDGPRYLSPDAYWATRARRGLSPAPQPGDTNVPVAASSPASGPPAASSPEAMKSADLTVAVSSTPAGAEIEVDGRFMGSTPSSIALAPGEHAVVVRKPGFKPWERKLQLTGGEIRLSADLEKDKAK
jgi:hypothetical protein